MKSFILVFLFFTSVTIGLTQGQTIIEDNYQIGMFNSSSSKKSFTFSKDFDAFSLQVSSLPLFANQFKIYSSLGVSGQLILNESEYGKVYTYSGVQRIQTKLGNEKEHINLGAGIGFKTKINQAVEFICQSGYNTLNVLKANRNAVFNSEVGVYYHF